MRRPFIGRMPRPSSIARTCLRWESIRRVLNGANIYGLENVAKLERLHAKGATLIALPIKIEQDSGGPARIIAILP